MQESTEIILPDLQSITPFTWDGCNPFFSRDDRHSTQWILGYNGTFTDRMRERLRVSRLEILGANAYTYADAKGLSIANNFIMLLSALEEITDFQDVKGAEATCDAVISAMTGTGSSVDDNGSSISKITKDFCATLPSMSEAVWQRLVAHCKEFLDGTIDEARLRADDEIPSFDKYLQIRRKSGVCPALFDFIEILLGITLPAEVFEEPNFVKVYDAINDMICTGNDIYSFPAEYERGFEGSNLVAVLMHNNSLTAQSAVNEAIAIYKKLAEIVISHKDQIRSFGPENDAAIRSYIYGIEQWACGHAAWYVDTNRYFGDRVKEVTRTRKVQLDV